MNLLHTFIYLFRLENTLTTHFDLFNESVIHNRNLNKNSGNVNK
jgi:hypothetical protein